MRSRYAARLPAVNPAPVTRNARNARNLAIGPGTLAATAAGSIPAQSSLAPESAAGRAPP
jgi:hypothetical protein